MGYWWYGQPFILRVYHALLKRLFQFKVQIPRLFQQPQEYDFKVEHHLGRVHGNADLLLRRLCFADCQHCINLE